MDFLDSVGKAIQEGAKVAVEKTMELKKVAEIKLEINTNKSKINDAYKAIGKLYFEKFADFPEEGFAGEVAKIKEANEKIAELEQQLNAEKEAKEAAKEAEATESTDTVAEAVEVTETTEE